MATGKPSSTAWSKNQSLQKTSLNFPQIHMNKPYTYRTTLFSFQKWHFHPKPNSTTMENSFTIVETTYPTTTTQGKYLRNQQIPKQHFQQEPFSITTKKKDKNTEIQDNSTPYFQNLLLSLYKSNFYIDLCLFLIV